MHYLMTTSESCVKTKSKNQTKFTLKGDFHQCYILGRCTVLHQTYITLFAIHLFPTVKIMEFVSGNQNWPLYALTKKLQIGYTIKHFEKVNFPEYLMAQGQ